MNNIVRKIDLLRLIKKSVLKFNLYRIKNLDIEINLSNVNLSEANLKTANLTKANLRGANLYGANLRGANLSEANLSGANLTGAILKDAELIGANLLNADLTGADLNGVNLTGATLQGVKGIYPKEQEMQSAQRILKALEQEGNKLDMDDFNTCICGWEASLTTTTLREASTHIPTLCKYYYRTDSEQALRALERVASGEESVWN